MDRYKVVNGDYVALIDKILKQNLNIQQSKIKQKYKTTALFYQKQKKEPCKKR